MSNELDGIGTGSSDVGRPVSGTAPALAEAVPPLESQVHEHAELPDERAGADVENPIVARGGAVSFAQRFGSAPTSRSPRSYA